MRPSSCCSALAVGLTVLGLGVTTAGLAQEAPERAHARVELRFIPAGFAQLAAWVQSADGARFSTVGLTEATALRGIGNRPGASQMNSGFRWPYGRREGALPVWARRRVQAGGLPFRRVIFKNRASEGLASRTSDDYSVDHYYCLSFDNSRSREDALDAVSCASVFNSDKGRFITQADLDSGYGEPYEQPGSLAGRKEPLSLQSLYPPRRDVVGCAPGCYEHADVRAFADHAREVMPEIDAVTMATPRGLSPKELLFVVPDDWPPGDYRACVEINVEGDDNDVYNEAAARTPITPAGGWDSWATGFGYPYRGQPSVVYCADFALGPLTAAEATTDRALGTVGSWDTSSPDYGELSAMDGMTNDPAGHPGSGADRLARDAGGARLRVLVHPARDCMDDAPPGPVGQLRAAAHPDTLHAHEWARLSFAAADDDTGVFRYEVRVSTEPIVDQESFLRGVPGKSASIAADELRIPADASAGATIELELGGLVAQTHYHIGVRALDGCARPSAPRVTELTTPARVFATVTPCVVATAAYGTPLSRELSALRRLRDRHLSSNALGRALVALYLKLGPRLADAIRGDERRRAAARALLWPVVSAARLVAGD